MDPNAKLDFCIFIPSWSLFHFISFNIDCPYFQNSSYMFSNSDFIPPLTNQIHTFPEHVLQFIRAQKKTQRAQWAVTVTFVPLKPPTDACSSWDKPAFYLCILPRLGAYCISSRCGQNHFLQVQRYLHYRLQYN